MTIDISNALRSPIIDFAITLVHKAGRTCRKYAKSSVSVMHKEDGSPVTIADQHIERDLKNAIHRAFPAHKIIGEEHGTTTHENTECVWYIDPIDGTYAFIHGIPLYTTLLAFYYKNIAQFGIIYNPQSDELVIGILQKGCYFNGHKTTLRPCESISNATLLTTDFSSLAREIESGSFQSLCKDCAHSLTWCDAYGYLLLVTGRADAVVDIGLKPWDIAPLYIIVQEACGTISNFMGIQDPLQGSCVATNPSIHQDLLSYLQTGNSF